MGRSSSASTTSNVQDIDTQQIEAAGGVGIGLSGVELGMGSSLALNLTDEGAVDSAFDFADSFGGKALETVQQTSRQAFDFSRIRRGRTRSEFDGYAPSNRRARERDYKSRRRYAKRYNGNVPPRGALWSNRGGGYCGRARNRAPREISHDNGNDETICRDSRGKR